MARYKNMEVHADLVGMIRHMDAVDEYRETLQNLQWVWDNLSLLGQLSGTGTDMGETREAFQALTTTLLNQLGLELRAKAMAELRAKAQAAIDVLVRNLFERTADIGFLATDDDIRAFLDARAGQADRPDHAGHADAAHLRERFAEYRAKYSVYFDILLFDAQGELLVRLDAAAPCQRSSAPLLAEALASDAPYVERFGRFDFLPQTESNGEAALVYACRVRDAAQQPAGVLVLAFRFEDEMARIFASLSAPDDHAVMLLLDAKGRVLTSSQAVHVPPGAVLPALRGGDCQVIEFAGNDYLFARRAPQAFQGYEGPPGWEGAVLLPLRYAFNKDVSRMLDGVDEAVLGTVMESSSLFGDALRSIPTQADRIQRDLNRQVWNGTVRQGGAQAAANPAFSKVLLWEISKTGDRTREVFARSIANLHETIVSAVLHDSRFLAAQAIDIMDRNLYERANDCRWWALTSAFRQLLCAGEPDADGRARMQEILAYINGLYTVYTNLIVFDREGRVQAVSQPQDGALLGQRLDAPWVRHALALKGSQAYAVSDFEPTGLYDARPTYVYAAAIRDPQDQAVVGGIGIVFDSAPQFQGMLRDILPRDEAGRLREGCFAVFADEAGKVIACSDDSFAPGQVLPPGVLDSGAQASGSARIVAVHGRYLAVGRQRSAGYREYKGEDDAYRNAVDAYVFLPLCDAVAEAAAQDIAPVRVASDRNRNVATVEIATFRIGKTWYGLPTADVIEAVERRQLVGVPGALSAFAGYQMVHGEPLPVFDIAPSGSPSRTATQVILLQQEGGRRFGILADDLGDIPEVALARQKLLPPDVRWGRNVMTESVIAADPPRDMGLLQVLRASRIHEWLLQACPEELTREPDLGLLLQEAA